MYAPTPVEADSRKPDQPMPPEGDLRRKRKEIFERVVVRPLSHRRDSNRIMCFKVKRADYEDPIWESRVRISDELNSKNYRRVRRREACTAAAETPQSREVDTDAESTD